MTTGTLLARPSQPVSAADPTPIFEALNRYQHTMALKGAIDLDLFTHILAGSTTPATLAVRYAAPERSIRILCDFLTVLGCLRKVDGHFSVAPHVAPFLDKASPAYVG